MEPLAGSFASGPGPSRSLGLLNPLIPGAPPQATSLVEEARMPFANGGADTSSRMEQSLTLSMGAEVDAPARSIFEQLMAPGSGTSPPPKCFSFAREKSGRPPTCPACPACPIAPLRLRIQCSLTPLHHIYPPDILGWYLYQVPLQFHRQLVLGLVLLKKQKTNLKNLLLGWRHHQARSLAILRRGPRRKAAPRGPPAAPCPPSRPTLLCSPPRHRRPPTMAAG